MSFNSAGIKSFILLQFFSKIAMAIKKAAIPLNDFAWEKGTEKCNKVVIVFKPVLQSYIEYQLRTLKTRKALISMKFLRSSVIRSATIHHKSALKSIKGPILVWVFPHFVVLEI